MRAMRSFHFCGRVCWHCRDGGREAGPVGQQESKQKQKIGLHGELPPSFACPIFSQKTSAKQLAFIKFSDSAERGLESQALIFSTTGLADRTRRVSHGQSDKRCVSWKGLNGSHCARVCCPEI